MTDYSKGKIYKIICDTDEIYVGSTIQSLTRRLDRHKSGYRGKATSELLMNKNPKIILIEDYSCRTRKELLIRERYWIDKIDCVNTDRPHITEEERKQYMREWSKNNTDKKNEYRREWRRFKASWGYNNYLGTSLNLLDIDPKLFN